jgi:predicted small secreted protein
MKKTLAVIAIATTLGACTQAELKEATTDAVVVAAVVGAACIASTSLPC